MIEKLLTRRIEKPWGRYDLSPYFKKDSQIAEKTGEVWFEIPGSADPELLVKYLFTSERLSVQVHPDDAAARAGGHARGKDEAWLILASEAGGSVGLGTVRRLTQEALLAASLDGSIERLLDWKPVKAGDFFYLPAGTVHAIGAGVTIIEVQQNVDLTYRLYDYGRPRALHLVDGVAVADARPYESGNTARDIGNGRTVLCDGRKFVVERWRAQAGMQVVPASERPIWMTIIAGNVAGASAGEVLYIDAATSLDATPGSDLLVAYTGADIVGGLLQTP